MSVYALSDLHGYYNLYQQVKEFLKPDDKVYFLGDAADRGPDGWKLIKAIYSDPQFEYLMGNHEHMLIHAMREYVYGEVSNSYPDGGMIICAYNGGASTLEEWMKEDDGAVWIHNLGLLGKKKVYVNKDNIRIHLSHAGFTPDREPMVKDLLWGRNHFHARWPKGKEFAADIIVHGHTPVQYLNEGWIKEDGIMTYCDGHKVDIDCGTYTSGLTCLLDLDTFDEHYFETQIA